MSFDYCVWLRQEKLVSLLFVTVVLIGSTDLLVYTSLVIILPLLNRGRLGSVVDYTMFGSNKNYTSPMWQRVIFIHDILTNG